MDTRKPIKARTDNRKIKEAVAYHKSFPFSEELTYQKEFNYGQAQINFVLNQIDKDFVAALNEIVKILKTLKGLPSASQQLSAIDFTKIETALADAKQRSETVAGIKPPGCETFPN